jgi:cytochrome P450
MAVALEAIFTRLPGIRVDELEWNQHSIFHGPRRMTVSWPLGEGAGDE